MRRWAPFAVQAAPWLALAALLAIWPTPPKPKKAGLSVQAEAHPHSFDIAEPGRGRLAPAPHAIPRKGWKDVLWRVFREIQRDNLPTVAGGVTFFTLLALFPAIGVFVSLYGLFADVNVVRAQLADLALVFPQDVLNIVAEQMLRLTERESSSLSMAFFVSLVLSVWTANAGMKALFEGLNVAYNEKEKRNFFKLTALTYVSTFGAIVFLTVVTAILIGIPLVLNRLGLGDVASLWTPMRWLLLLAIAAGCFSVMYRFAPCRRRARWRWVVGGGGFAAVLWLGGSLGFSWYVNNVARYDVTYGSLGTVIGFMMWIWFSVMVVLIGAELNAEIEHQTALDSTTGAAKPMGERGATMADSVGLAFHFHPKQMLSGIMPTGRNQAARVEAAKKAQLNSSSKAANRAA